MVSKHYICNNQIYTNLTQKGNNMKGLRFIGTFAAFCLLWLLPTASKAQAYWPSLFVHTTDNKQVVFHLNEIGNIYRDEAYLFFNTVGGEQIAYPYEDIVKFTFGKDSSVDEISSERIEFSYSNNTLSAKGLKSGNKLTVYTVSGTVAASTIADSMGVARIDMSDMPKGVYIVSTNGISYKIAK